MSIPLRSKARPIWQLVQFLKRQKVTSEGAVITWPELGSHVDQEEAVLELLVFVVHPSDLLRGTTVTRR
jgi:hypothetical protein